MKDVSGEWEATKTNIADHITGETVTVQACGWQHSDEPPFAGVAIDGKVLSSQTARWLVDVLLGAIADGDHRASGAP